MSASVPPPIEHRSPRLARPRRYALGAAGSILTLLLAALLTLAPTAAHAADRGAGFGEWAPLSASGWHGSMRVGDLHTYCISPGIPAPTGATTDRGVRSDVDGLTPQQLTAINRLVSTYGQTDDPVTAAAVGWAVRTIADRATALATYGYGGDSLAEAVHWSFSRLAPEHSGRVQELAERFHAEATATPVATTDGSLTLTTDPADPQSGTVSFAASGSSVARVVLEGAVFADSGAAERDDVRPGDVIAIVAATPADGSMLRVIARATVDAGWAPAVRLFTTPGQQNTAGPGGRITYEIETTDAAPRPARFAPTVSTQVLDAGIGDVFRDDVSVSTGDAAWPRTADGTHVSVAASAAVYRTASAPTSGSALPDDAEHVGDLAATLSPGSTTVRTESDWTVTEPGFYTAVWTIRRDAQSDDVRPHLPTDYVWIEEWGTPTQVLEVAEPVAPAPEPEETPAAAPESPADVGLGGDVLAATGGGDGLRTTGAALAALIMGAAILAHVRARRRGSASRFGAGGRSG